MADANTLRYNDDMKAKGKVKIKWSSNFAYAIGLLVTDGNLSPDGRHINFTTKDQELAEIFKRMLLLDNAIGKKARGHSQNKKYFVVQFGDVIFYDFLLKIGLMPNKSKKLKEIEIPNKYFFDFLRGHSDGDGTFYSYWDPRWRSSFMFYTVFISASHDHLIWLQDAIREAIGINGHMTKSESSSVWQLKYAKSESLKLLPKMYYNAGVFCLKRKRIKIEKALEIEGRKL